MCGVGVTVCGVTVCGVTVCGVTLCGVGVTVCGVTVCGVTLCGVTVCGVTVCGVTVACPRQSWWCVCAHTEAPCSGGFRNLERGFTAEGSEERREVPICHPRKVRKMFFTIIFQLPGWAVVAPSCFALHCHCSLVSVQSVTVCMTLDVIPFQLSVQKNTYGLVPSLCSGLRIAAYIDGTVAS